jgi:hypothetical protein
MPKEDQPEPTPEDWDNVYQKITQMTKLTPQDGVFSYTLSGENNPPPNSYPGFYFSLFYVICEDGFPDYNDVYISCNTSYDNQPETCQRVLGMISPPATEDNLEYNPQIASELGSKLNDLQMPSITLAFHVDPDNDHECGVTLHTIQGIPPKNALATIKTYLEAYMDGNSDDDEEDNVLSDCQLVYSHDSQITNKLTRKNYDKLIALSKEGDGKTEQYILEGSNKIVDLTTEVVAGIFVQQSGNEIIYCPQAISSDSLSDRQLFEIISNLEDPVFENDTDDQDQPEILHQNEQICAQDKTPLCALVIGHDHTKKPPERYVILTNMKGLSARSAIDFLKKCAQQEIDLFNHSQN